MLCIRYISDLVSIEFIGFLLSDYFLDHSLINYISNHCRSTRNLIEKYIIGPIMLSERKIILLRLPPLSKKNSRSSNIIDVPIITHSLLDLAPLIPLTETSYSALIVTSRRAADALKEILEEHPSPNSLLNTPVAVVGPRTEAAISSLGFSTFGSECGLAEALAEYLLSRSSERSRFLFLCGKTRRDVLPKLVRLAGHEVVEYEVYETMELEGAVETVKGLVEKHPTPWVVFFSSQGVNSIVEYVKNRNNVKIASIGETTKGFLESKGLLVSVVGKGDVDKVIEKIEDHEKEIDL